MFFDVGLTFFFWKENKPRLFDRITSKTGFYTDLRI